MAQICPRLVLLSALFLIAGCFHPSPYGGGYYGQQQQFAPNQPGYMQQPGTLVIPPSNDPLQAPGTPTSTFDEEPLDNFTNDGRGGDGQFFERDSGGVPLPDAGSGSGFDSEF